MAERFNYISFANWEYLEESVDAVATGRRCMFEYTLENIRYSL